MGLFNFNRRMGGLIKYFHLENWFNSLSIDEKEKLIQYAEENLTEGELLSTSQTVKGILSNISYNALYKNDIDFAIMLSTEALKAEGSSVNQHFAYNTIIEAYFKNKDYENTKKYCNKELEEWTYINKALLKEFNNELPPSIPFRDTLIHILKDIEKNYSELRHIYDLFFKEGVIDKDEFDEDLKELEILEMIKKAEILLNEDDYKNALDIFNEVIRKDELTAPEIYKKLGSYFFERKEYKESLDYYEKALQGNPIISGVKSKINKISKILKTDVKDNTKETILFLEAKGKSATEWWSKRDLANEFVKIKQHDRAWALFNEAILLRAKDGMPCDTIYSHMANMLIKESRFKNALLQYAFYFKEWLSFSDNIDFPKYVVAGITKCLSSLGIDNLSYLDFFNLVKKERDPSKFAGIVNKLS